MKLKPFLQLIYGSAGLFISLFTAVMTYLIIGEPIGMKMTSEIAITVIATLPMIIVVSYFIGVYLSKKFAYISSQLDAIDENKFLETLHEDNVEEITHIHHSILHLSQRLKTTITQLQNQNEHLNTVIKSLSHDIKTPLTIIDGYLDEFEDQLICEDEIPRVISVLKKEVAYLKELSSEVIFYIQSQEIKPTQQEKIMLKEFLHQEVCPLLRVDDTVTLECKIQEYDAVLFHPTSLKQILFNLLHNAIKYTQNGTITISYKDAQIMVTDTGIGIDQGSDTKIFEPFVSLESSKNRETSGFGLGLSIALNLAKNNHHDLFLDTTYTSGTRFILKPMC